jgi:hypothetical protein
MVQWMHMQVYTLACAAMFTLWHNAMRRLLRRAAWSVHPHETSCGEVAAAVERALARKGGRLPGGRPLVCVHAELDTDAYCNDHVAYVVVGRRTVTILDAYKDTRRVRLVRAPRAWLDAVMSMPNTVPAWNAVFHARECARNVSYTNIVVHIRRTT